MKILKLDSYAVIFFSFSLNQPTFQSCNLFPTCPQWKSWIWLNFPSNCEICSFNSQLLPWSADIKTTSSQAHSSLCVDTALTAYPRWTLPKLLLSVLSAASSQKSTVRPKLKASGLSTEDFTLHDIQCKVQRCSSFKWNVQCQRSLNVRCQVKCLDSHVSVKW